MTLDSGPPKFSCSDWHHAPIHRFQPGCTYIVTAGTLYRQHYFHTDEHLRKLERLLLDSLLEARWRIHAWSVFSNHYHFIGDDWGRTTDLKELIGRFHSRTALSLNQAEKKPGRQIWFQYWDRCLTFESSYWARLNCIHNNAVRHGLVTTASDYPFCSARLFETRMSSGFLRRLKSYRCQRVEIYDPFEPVWERRLR